MLFSVFIWRKTAGPGSKSGWGDLFLGPGIENQVFFKNRCLSRQPGMSFFSKNWACKICFDEARRRYAELSKIKAEREQAVANAPEGRIHIVRSGKKVQFYLRADKSDKSGRYIHKNDKKTIKKYLQKSYDEEIIKAIGQELQGLERLFKKSDSSVDNIRQIYSGKQIEIKSAISPVDVSDEDFVKKWIDKSYVGKEISDYVPFYDTKRKERVRSKSELNIANMLDSYGVPYKYECPLKLKDGKVIYPDFTVINVKSRKVIYWEHRGMMDDKNYANMAVSRIKQMRKSKICLGDNLIITEETAADPLGTDEIKFVIKKYLI